MTLDTTQRVLLAVPVPRTELTIGQFFEKPRTDAQSVTSQYSGVSVYTDADVRFNAMGEWSASNKESDLVLQSKGQLWMQAVGKTVALAGTNVLVSSPSATLIAGQRGVTILAGFRPGPITPEREAGSFPPAVKSYESTAKIPKLIWGIFDIVYTYARSVIEALTFLTVGGDYGIYLVRGMPSMAVLGVNIASMAGSPNVPGIHMFSQAGTLIGSAASSVSIAAVPAVLIASTFTTQFALVTSGVRGLVSCAMFSLKTADVSALYDVTVRASKKLSLASRTGETRARGATMKVGNMKPKPPQLPTTSLEMQAVQQIELISLLETKLVATTPTAGSGFSSKAATESTIEGDQKVRFKVGVFEISLGPSETMVGFRGAGPKIACTAEGVKIEGPGGVATAELGRASIALVAGVTGQCKFDLAQKRLTVDGMSFDIK